VFIEIKDNHWIRLDQTGEVWKEESSHYVRVQGVRTKIENKYLKPLLRAIGVNDERSKEEEEVTEE